MEETYKCTREFKAMTADGNYTLSFDKSLDTLKEMRQVIDDSNVKLKQWCERNNEVYHRQYYYIVEYKKEEWYKNEKFVRRVTEETMIEEYPGTDKVININGGNQ